MGGLTNNVKKKTDQDSLPPKPEKRPGEFLHSTTFRGHPAWDVCAFETKTSTITRRPRSGEGTEQITMQYQQDVAVVQRTHGHGWVIDWKHPEKSTGIPPVRGSKAPAPAPAKEQHQEDAHGPQEPGEQDDEDGGQYWDR